MIYHDTDLALKDILKAIILAAGEPLKLERLLSLFEEDPAPPTKEEVVAALEQLTLESEQDAMAFRKTATGYQYQVRQPYAPWIQKLFEQKPPRYSRAVFETLALVAYRQPITRAEIEAVRGVAVSSHVIKMLTDREWIKVVGHKDTPGKPALFATTREFLDHFNLETLKELPSLAEIKDFEKEEEKVAQQLELEGLEEGAEAEVNAQEDVAQVTEDVDGDESSTVRVADSELDDIEQVESASEGLDELTDYSQEDVANVDEEAPIDESLLDMPEEEIEDNITRNAKIVSLVKMAEALDAKLSEKHEAESHEQARDESHGVVVSLGKENESDDAGERSTASETLDESDEFAKLVDETLEPQE